MVFKLSNTFKKPVKGENSQRGFPSPGEGAQTTGTYQPMQQSGIDYTPFLPTMGEQTFSDPCAPQNSQRGFAGPYAQNQKRPACSMPNIPLSSGRAQEVYTPSFSRGAAAFVQNFGKVLFNPIGAGVVVKHRPQASYGISGQYLQGQIFWTSQAIPTSINLQGLTDPKVLLDQLGMLNVQAVVRVS